MEEYLCPETNKPIYWLNVDEFVVLESHNLVKTVLGSCVGIILFDRQSLIFGVNHYLNRDSGSPLNEKLLAAMKQKGAKQLAAIIAGGANTMSKQLNVGEDNIKLAQEFLKQHNIPLKKMVLGKNSGMTITVGISEEGIDFQPRMHRVRGTIQEEIQQEKKEFQNVKDALEEFKKIYEKSCLKKE